MRKADSTCFVRIQYLLAATLLEFLGPVVAVLQKEAPGVRRVAEAELHNSAVGLVSLQQGGIYILCKSLARAGFHEGFAGRHCSGAPSMKLT